ncbi:MAG: NUDIX domain-containing protein [Anaerolineales bacterium]
MSPSVDPNRYTVIPRTLSFLQRADEVLLLRLPSDHPDWPGRYNGVGGHIDIGEDAAGAARREIREETGLEAEDLRLRGTVLIETGQTPGIALYIFSGRASGTPSVSGRAGEPRWVNRAELARLPLVEDVPTLMRLLLESPIESPFSALYQYTARGELEMVFDGAATTQG